VIDQHTHRIILVKTHVFERVNHGSSMQGWRCP
jgi:hypothetical protein